MIEFILNDRLIKSELPEGLLLIDFLRENQRLKGTKSACREGDCGSCAVIEGSFDIQTIKYRAVASCLTPMGNVHGKHIVTIEGLEKDKLSPIQESIIDEAATQCGYCTPGIVISLTAYILSAKEFSFESAKDAVGGNICRCTGYKSIERALITTVSKLKKSISPGDIRAMIKNHYLPEYFSSISEKLVKIKPGKLGTINLQKVAGGTDLFVQKAEQLVYRKLTFISTFQNIHEIEIQGDLCVIGAGCKISDLEEHEVLKNKIPGFEDALKLIGSKLIRNMATIGGNFVNASPIGDLSIIFLALNASLLIKNEAGKERNIGLKDFFKAYKKIDLLENEYIESVSFLFPEQGTHFHFEKVSKRKFLDIASVNSAICISFENEVIRQVHIALGGVAPIPLYINKTCQFLTGKSLDKTILNEASKILTDEIKPIDDIRGGAAYKAKLARQLLLTHFVEIFPGRFESALIYD